MRGKLRGRHRQTKTDRQITRLTQTQTNKDRQIARQTQTHKLQTTNSNYKLQTS